MIRAIWRWVLMALSGLAAVAGATAPAVAQPAVSPALTTSPSSGAAAYSGTCPNGAPARDVRFCRFILRYNTKPGTLSTVVGDFLGVTQASQTRSIGLIIAVEKYPGMPGHDLPAAKIDGDLLQDFLIKDQQFDEVIVLRDSDASVENINYFMEDYLPNHADDYRNADGQGKARLLIAYSGHGRADTPSARAAFVLSAATAPEGSSGIYKMTDFTTDVAGLASHYFHVLTLINACFGANVFTIGNTGAAATPTGPGSFIITAGSPKNEVEALIPPRGSLFFDLIVNGVTNGEVDTQSWKWYLTDGNDTVQAPSNLTLTLPLYSYLSGAFYQINAVQKRADPAFEPISAPYFGPVQNSGMAQGGFFFFSDKSANQHEPTLAAYLKPLAPGAPVETASIGGENALGHHHRHLTRESPPPSLSAPAPPPALPPPAIMPPAAPRPDMRASHLPFGPISSLQGRPDIKIFKQPAIYPVKGYDLSSSDGKIDWQAFASGPRPSFLYVRALGWAGADPSFADIWAHAKSLGMDRGAYLKFNFCLPVTAQVARLRHLAPPGADILPVGIELVIPTADQPQGAAQLECYQSIGPIEARNRILTMAAAVRQQWGKIPVLLGNSYNLSVLTDSRSAVYMIWLDAYGPQNGLGEQLKLKGRNPWTIWQYSSTLQVAGLSKPATGEVFFGTLAQYEAFRQAKENVALAAVR